MSARKPAYNVGRYIVQVALYRGRMHARWNQALKQRSELDLSEYLNWDDLVAEIPAWRSAEAGA